MPELTFGRIQEILDSGASFVLATVVSVRGSVPRGTGARMLIHPDGRGEGTVGGGKFEDLVIGKALEALADGASVLTSWPLHERHPESFGAVCGGEVTVFLEPFPAARRLLIRGAGHCGRALARMARDLDLRVVLTDDREERLDGLEPGILPLPGGPGQVIAQWTPRAGDALALLNRNADLDQEGLAAALALEPGFDYLDMIGSRRKVRHVFDTLRAQGVPEEKLRTVHAPIGLDIGAETPAEIAVSILAEILQGRVRSSELGVRSSGLGSQSVGGSVGRSS